MKLNCAQFDEVLAYGEVKDGRLDILDANLALTAHASGCEDCAIVNTIFNKVLQGQGDIDESNGQSREQMVRKIRNVSSIMRLRLQQSSINPEDIPPEEAILYVHGAERAIADFRNLPANGFVN